MMPRRAARLGVAELPPPIDIEVVQLFLDARNPRLGGMDLSVEQQDEITKVLWEERAVNERVDSIATSGYWRHEELIACREAGKLVVVEGNRRLAAVKLLSDADLRQRLGISGLPTLSAAELERLKK